DEIDRLLKELLSQILINVEVGATPKLPAEFRLNQLIARRKNECAAKCVPLLDLPPELLGRTHQRPLPRHREVRDGERVDGGERRDERVGPDAIQNPLSHRRSAELPRTE